MNKKSIFFLSIVLISGFGFAQKKEGADAGINVFKKSFQKDPSPENAYQLGLAYYQIKENTDAIVYLSKATLKTVEPALASNAYLYRGIIRIREKSFTDAYADLRKSLALNPKNAEVYRHRGLAQISSGDYIKAVQDFGTYTMYADKSWESYNALASDILKSGTTNKELIEKAHDLVLLSSEKNKNTINQQTLNEIEVSLRKTKETPTKNPATELVAREAASVKVVEQPTKIVQKPKASADVKVAAELPKTSSAQANQQKETVAIKKEEPVIETPPSVVKGLEIPDIGKLRKAKIWAVVIGVSIYTTTKSLNLKYANTDADLFYNFLRSPAGGSIPAEQITLVTNEKATRTEILKAMKSTFGKAYDTDVIVLYIASHGQTENGEFYFLTTEAEPGFLDATALSRSSVAEAFKNKSIRAKKKIIFADACHSGELMKVDLGARGNDEAMELEKSNQLLVEMAQSNEGCAIMTASTGGQKSYEDVKWGGGHGIFTYSLIEGLKGKADYDENKVITLNEINEYVFRSVTDATLRKQQPSFQGTFDDNFPMSVVIK